MPRRSVMKSIMNRMLVVLMVGALTSVVALAKVQKHRVTFDSDIKVNGTLVKKGKVIAQAMAKLEPRAKKANDFQLRSNGSGDDTHLTGVTFGGSDKDVVISAGGATTTGNN